MADFAFVAVIVVFFALCALFVRGCDRIVRSDDDTPVDAAEVTS